MYKVFSVSLALLLLALGSSNAAYAGVVIAEQLPQTGNTGNAFRSDFDTFAGPSGPQPPVQMGDDVTLPELTGQNLVIDWWGLYGFSGTIPADDFSIRLFRINAGIIDVNPVIDVNVGTARRSATGDAFFGFPVFEYSSRLNNVVLPAGDYLLSLVNATLAAQPDDESWFWRTNAFQPGIGDAQTRSADGTPWVLSVDNGSQSELSFRVSIPEPGVLPLMLMGFIGTALVGRSRSSKGARCAA